jgi:hypothetical protein
VVPVAEQNIDAADPLDPSDIHAAEQLALETREEVIARKQAKLRARRDSYRRLFAGNAMPDDHDIVLADLKRFCRGSQTPWDADPRVHALLTGRFEVYNRIVNHLNMSFDDLWEMLEGPSNE